MPDTVTLFPASQQSPYNHKLRLCLNACGVSWVWFGSPSVGDGDYTRIPKKFSSSLALRWILLNRRVGKLKSGRARPQLPADFDPAMDELPLTPYVFGPGFRDVMVDSTAIALWASREWAPRTGRPGLFPADPEAADVAPEDEALLFIALFLEDFMDEWGQILAFHHRWSFSSDTVDVGLWTMRENAFLTGLLSDRRIRRLADRFNRRQVPRLPYHFSFAPRGTPAGKGKRSDLPAPVSFEEDGFPSTHELIEESYRNTADALDVVYREQPFLLGNRFQICDAAFFGQLYQKIHSDIAASEELRARAPAFFEWALERGLAGIPEPSGRYVPQSRPEDPFRTGEGGLWLSPLLKPLLREACETYVPLMQQNEAAWLRLSADGVREFNESGFRSGKSVYDLELRGRPYRFFVKSFQVRSWRAIVARWRGLSAPARAKAVALLPEDHGLG